MRIDKRCIIVYDISNGKRRRKICKLLESCGVRIQESVFECLISEYCIKSFFEKLTVQLNPKEDKIKIFTLSANCITYEMGFHASASNPAYLLI